MDRKECGALRERLQVALDGALASLGVESAQAGNAKYDDDGVTITVRLTVAGGRSVLARDWDRGAEEYGFERSDLDRTFHSGGHDWTIVGLKPRASKRPIMARREDGKIFKFQPGPVLLALGRTVPEWLLSAAF